MEQLSKPTNSPKKIESSVDIEEAKPSKITVYLKLLRDCQAKREAEKKAANIPGYMQDEQLKKDIESVIDMERRVSGMETEAKKLVEKWQKIKSPLSDKVQGKEVGFLAENRRANN